MAAVGAVVGLLAIGGVWRLASAPPPAPVPPVEPGPAPMAGTGMGTGPGTPSNTPDTAKEVQRVLARQTALDVVVKSRGELALGNLDGAQRLLDASRVVLDSVSEDPEIQPQIEGLRSELSQVGDALSRAQALAKRGDCVAAIRLYDEILKAHSGFKQARAAREQCKRMLPPQLAE
jgi:hypothetical protein